MGLTSEGRDEDTSRNLDAKGHYSQGTLHKHCDKKRAYNGLRLGGWIKDTKAGMGILATVTALSEEVVYELSTAHTSVGVEEAQ